MSQRYFNWKLAIVLLIGVTVLAATALGLRQWQRASRVTTGLRLGTKAYDEHNWAEAAAQLGHYLAVRQDDVPVLLKYAEAVLNIRPLKSGSIQQAVASYRIVLRVAPENLDAAKKLAELYLMIGAPGEAELIISKYLEKSQSPELRRLLAISLARQRKFDEAAAQLKLIIAAQPGEVLAYDTLGQLTEQRQDSFPDSADIWFDQAVTANPTAAMAYIVRAGHHLRTNNTAKAVADLAHAETLDLSNNTVRLRLAQEYAGAAAFDKAEEHLAVVQKTDPANRALWDIWAQLAVRSQSKERMLKVADAGLKGLSSQPWDFMPVAAELFVRAGQFDRAADCVRQLRQQDVNPSATAFLEGFMADREGHPHEAVKCWQKAMELGNKSPQLRLAMAATLSGLGDIQSAIWQMRTLVSEKPDLPDGHMALARLCAQIGEYAEAADHAGRAAQLAPTNSEAALLYLQTKIRLLASRSRGSSLAATGTPQNLHDQELDNQLARLEKASGGAVEVELMKANLQVQRGEFAAARALLDDLKKAHPANMEVAMAEVDILAAQGKTNDAVSALETMAESFPQAMEPVRYLAVMETRKDDYDRAEKIITDALSRIEQPAAQRELTFLLADVYAARKKEDEAYRVLGTLEQKQPDSIIIKRRILACVPVISDRSRAQRLVDDVKSLEGADGWQWRYEQAKLWSEGVTFKEYHPQIVSLLKEALLANPDDQLSRTLLASTYKRSGGLQLAISMYREALAHSPGDMRIAVPLIEALYQANEYDRADEVLQQIASEKPLGPELRQLELQGHLRRGEIASASDILEELLAKDPNNRSVCVSLALLQMRQNKFAEAGELLARLRAVEPDSPLIGMADIEFHLRQGKSAEALALCDKMVSLYHTAWAYSLQGKAYAMLGRNQEAIGSMENAVAAEPNNGEAWAAASDLYNSLGLADKAASAVQKAMVLDPDNGQIRKRAIMLLLRSGIPDHLRKGNDLLDEAIKARPEDGELSILKAQLLASRGTAPAVKQASAIARAVTNSEPRLTGSWLLLGQIAMREGRIGDAVDIASQGLIRAPEDRMLLGLKARAEMVRTPSLAIPTLNALRELDANDLDTLVLLSEAYVAAGKAPKAVEILESYLARGGAKADVLRARLALAGATYKSGDAARSGDIFRSLYESSPGDANVLLAEARLLSDSRMWNQVAQRARQWRQDHKDDTMAPVMIAALLSGTGDSEARGIAETMLRETLAAHPDSIDAMSAMATLLQVIGRSVDAEAFYRKVLDDQPLNLIAMNNLAWILCEERGKFQEAFDLSDKGLKITDYVDLIDTRGVASYRLGQYDRAAKDLRKCIELYLPGTASATSSYFHLGRVLAVLGQKDEAVQNLDKALKLNGDSGGLSARDITEAQRIREQLLSQGRS